MNYNKIVNLDFLKDLSPNPLPMEFGNSLTTSEIIGKIIHFIETTANENAEFKKEYENIIAELKTTNVNLEKYLKGEDIPEDIITRLSNAIVNHDNMIIIGDSYGQGYTPENVTIKSWIDYLKTMLKYNRLYSRSYGGSGFSKRNETGKNFLDCLTSLEEEVEDKNSIGLIIVGGGANDISESKEDIVKNINDFLEYTKANYPNSKIVLAPFGVIRTGTINNLYGWRNMISAYSSSNAICLSTTNVLKDNTLLCNDYVHPNEKGQMEIAKSVFQNLSGGKYFNLVSRGTNIVFSDNLTSSGRFRIAQYPTLTGVDILFPDSVTLTLNENSTINKNSTVLLQIGELSSTGMLIAFMDLIKIPVKITVHDITTNTYILVDGVIEGVSNKIQLRIYNNSVNVLEIDSFTILTNYTSKHLQYSII